MIKHLGFLLAMTLFFGNLVWVLSGCDKKPANSSGTPAVEKATNQQFQGNIVGCKQHWDDFYCGKRTLNSGNVTLIRDQNGTPIVLNPQKGE